MGSTGNYSNGLCPVEYSSLMKCVTSVERMFDDAYYEILVEPKMPQYGRTFRFILEKLPTCPCVLPGKDAFHVNASLKSRTKRSRRMQLEFQRYTEKSHQALKCIQKKYSKLKFNFAMIKNQISLKDKTENRENIPEIRLQLGFAEDIEMAKQFCRKGPDGEEESCRVAESQPPCNISSDSDDCYELESSIIRGLSDVPAQVSRLPMSVEYIMNLAHRSRRQLHVQNALKILRRIQVLKILQKKGRRIRPAYDTEREKQRQTVDNESDVEESQPFEQGQIEEEQNAAGSYTEVFLVCT